jgi:hypothetical protein
MKPVLFALLLTVLLCSKASAQDPVDPETLFHQSYLQEVVQGHVDVAALGYFKLMEDEKVNAALRAESRFRFAVCMVLLGRADEARARLLEVLSDEGAPEALKRRAEEYRATLSGLGTGSELSKKLEALAFELGRLDLQGDFPATYRDFQIIGEPAVPFLRGLLAHPDEILRQHAFRVLLRMDVPGMAELWGLERFGHYCVVRDLKAYLNRHQAERTWMEQCLPALPDEEANAKFVLLWSGPAWSTAFLEQMAKKDGRAVLVCRLAFGGPMDPERRQAIDGWLTSDNSKLAWFAASALTKAEFHEEMRDAFSRPEVLRAVVRSFTGKELSWRPRSGNASDSNDFPWERGLQAFCVTLETQAVLDELERLVEVGEAWEGEPKLNPLVTGLADALVVALLGEKATRPQLEACADLLGRWMQVRRRPEVMEVAGKSRPPFPDDAFRRHIASISRRLPGESAIRLTKEWLAWTDQREVTWLMMNFAVARGSDVRILRAAMEAEEVGKRGWMVGLLIPHRVHPSFAPAVAKALIEESSALADLLLDRHLDKLLGVLPWAAARVEPEVAVDALVALGPRLNAFESPRGYILKQALRGLSSADPDGPAFRRTVAVPSLEPLWEVLDEDLHQSLVQVAVGFLADENQGRLPLGDALPMLAEFLTEHVAEVSESYYLQLAQQPELIPLECWVPLCTPGQQPRREVVNREDADRAARRMVADPGKVNIAVLEFIRDRTTDQVKRELLTGLVETSSRKLLSQVLYVLRDHEGTVSPEVLEKRLGELLEGEAPSLVDVARLTTMLSHVAPSERLFPAAKFLLASGDREAILVGARVAENLGRAELLGSLAAVLTSMDPVIRATVKRAMNSIEALQKLLRDQAAREAGLE